jgi:hypothetical protein
MKKTLSALFLVFLVIGLSCDSGDKDDKPRAPVDTFDDSSLSLASGINITSVDGDLSSVISGMSHDDMVAFTGCINACMAVEPPDPACFMDCFNIADLFPDGGTFNLCMKITNVTISDITITISAGTRFNPSSDDLQPMLVIYDITITVTPGTHTCCIPVYCLARSKNAPSSAQDTYDSVEEIPETGCLRDIVAITSTKDIANLNNEQLSDIQDIIWDCMDDETVDLDYLNGLPDAP